MARKTIAEHAADILRETDNPAVMKLTDKDRAQIREAASVPSNQQANPDTCRALLALLDENESLRQQLAALRDRWRENAKRRFKTIGDEAFSDGLDKAADELDNILKGTP